MQKHARLKLKGVDDEPQPKYRDRAAERRTLHKGFGIGPGQKVVNIQELEKEEADAATEMPAALEKAASARPIGRDNIGKRMLEGMGWKEVSCVCVCCSSFITIVGSTDYSSSRLRVFGLRGVELFFTDICILDSCTWTSEFCNCSDFKFFQLFRGSIFCFSQRKCTLLLSGTIAGPWRWRAGWSHLSFGQLWSFRVRLWLTGCRHPCFLFERYCFDLNATKHLRPTCGSQVSITTQNIYSLSQALVIRELL